MVRAKFRHSGFDSRLNNNYPHKLENGQPDYTRPERCEMRTLHFDPVYANNDPNHENSKFWNATPSGRIELGTINPEAWSQFEFGKEYYIDFTPAE